MTAYAETTEQLTRNEEKVVVVSCLCRILKSTFCGKIVVEKIKNMHTNLSYCLINFTAVVTFSY